MENIQSSAGKRDDEIDLVELIKVLWNKKIWIVLSTIVFTALAAVYAFTAKEQWTSKAEVIELGSFWLVLFLLLSFSLKKTMFKISKV